MRLVFEKSVPGRIGHELPRLDVDTGIGIGSRFIRDEPANLPELSEPDVVRHYTGLSKLNHGVDSGFYPLGSCTMKYNPKINEDVSGLFGEVHPMANAPGSLRLMRDLSDMLCEITGMDEFSMQPAAGAHGELAGLMIIKAYHEAGGGSERVKMLVPGTAHGTNPASAMMAGFETVEVASDAEGNVDLVDLRRHIAECGNGLAGLMLTNPSTLGLFETGIEEIAGLVHDAGGLLYYDGANLNAIMGITRPGDMGFDVIHLNLHKTFSTPHGGGGPGAGPVGVKGFLTGFLPEPVIIRDENGSPCKGVPGTQSIGRMRSFYGNFGVMVKAYAYILSMGAEGLRAVSDNAIINANYLRKCISEFLEIAIDRVCMHEFVATGRALKESGVSTLDVAKRLIDFGIHPPTVYFPLIIKEALMIEPTETESKQTLDGFIEAMRAIVTEAAETPEVLRAAPLKAPVGRLDDTRAARKPVLVAP